MRAVLVLVLSLPALARADAVAPLDGACPPGLGRGLRHHAEVCIPTACTGDRDCGEDARCVAVFECWAARPEAWGRTVPPTPNLVSTVVGACDADRHCAEGACRERRQCEPTEDTPAWDRAEHRWTGRPHPTGCHAGRGGTGPWWLFALVLTLGRRAWR